MPSSIDSLIEILYDIISGPADEPRDWDRLRSLFLSGARLVRTESALEGETQVTNQTVEEFIEDAKALLAEQDFFEGEVTRQTERFGQVAHVFSTYQTRLSPEADEPDARGINSIQLYHDGERWWIVNMLWETETEERPIPPEYLPEEASE